MISSTCASANVSSFRLLSSWRRNSLALAYGSGKIWDI